MTKTYWPFSTGAGATVTEAQWSIMMSLLTRDGVVQGELNSLAVFADSSGMQVKVPSGEARIQGHVFRSDAQETLAIGSNSSGSTRIDRVMVRLSWTAKTIDFVVVQGTTSAPSLTRSATIWDISLAQVSVANGAATIAAGNVTDERADITVCGWAGLGAPNDPPEYNADVTAGALGKGHAELINTGGTITLGQNYNVASFTDHSVGDYTVTWDRDFSTVNYPCVVTPGIVGSSFPLPAITAKAVGSIRTQILRYDTGGNIDGNLSVIADGTLS